MNDDTIRAKYQMEAKPVICPICTGSLSYHGLGEYVCEQCQAVILDDYGKVRKFLDANGPSPAVIISEGTGVPVSKINQFLRDGRVEIPDGSSIYIRCESCGTEIRFGRYCPNCASKMSKNIQGVMMDTGETPKSRGSEGGMRYLGRNKKDY